MCSMLRLAVAFCAAAFVIPTSGQDAPSGKPSTGDEPKEVDPVISQLTLAMSAQVIDERTFAIRDSSKGSKLVHLTLGNVGPAPRGSLNDGEYAEKVKVAKEALGKLVDRQMIWYKAAPDSVQTANSTDAAPSIIADVWTSHGQHINSFLKKEGHLSDEQAYETDLAKDILTVAAEVEKKESYKKLEEALKESEKAKKEAAKADRAKAQEEESAEVGSFGVPGYLGVSVLLAIGAGVLTNFGRPSNKKVNLNRKKGHFERFWMKLKGA